MPALSEAEPPVHHHEDDVSPYAPTRSVSDDSITSNPVEPPQQAHTTELECSAERMAQLDLFKTRTGTSVGSRLLQFEVDFGSDDPDDPRNWPLWYRAITIAVVSYSCLSVVIYSTSYTSGMPGMMADFGIKNETIATLGVTMYLLGLASGSLVVAPLSEIYGRRPVYATSLLFFCLMVLPSALATSLAEILVTRFIGALAGSAMIANSPGTIADITTEEYRALAFSIWSLGPLNGPVAGPVIGGFTAEYLGWRWTNWMVMILSGAGWVFSSLIKETYAPVILRAKAEKKRKETDDDRYWSRYDQEESVIKVLKLNLSRPFSIAFTEPICWFWNAYIAVIYAILYLCFVAYPLIYTDLRGWSLGNTGLAFLGIGGGTLIAILTEPLVRKMINGHDKDPETGVVPPEAAVSIICIGAFLIPIGQLWFSWTSVPITNHWVWPILAGVPFGCGNTWVFIYATNYLAGSYGVFAASALAGNSVFRSIFGGALPLAGPTMYAALTPQWAGTLLGLVQVIMIPIPLVFYKYGDRIRAKSPLIRQMRADEDERAGKARRQMERMQRRDRVEAKATKDVEKGPNAKIEEAGEELEM